MTNATLQQEALERARGGNALTNLPTVYREFMARGIPEADIHPRVNVLTYNAWRALGRHVRKGEKGVHLLTWIPMAEKKNEQGEVTRKASKRPWTATVFHVSQTDPN